MSQSESEESPSVTDEAATRPARNAAVERYLAAREARKTAPPELLPNPPAHDEDTLWRGLLRDGQMRLLVSRATVAMTEIAERLQTSPEVTRALAEFWCGAQLVRATIHPDEAIQLACSQEGGMGNFVVDIHDDGTGRAMVRHPDCDGPPIVGGRLQVTRLRRGVGKYRSSIEMMPDERPTQLLMRYLQDSEQILSLLDVDVQLDDAGSLVSVVGSVVQMMPEGSREDLARLVSNLETAGTLRAAMTAEDPDGIAWAARVLEGFFWDQVARQDVGFACTCSAERVITLIASLSAADIAELIEGLETLETTCDYCRTTWSTPVSQLQPLLASPS